MINGKGKVEWTVLKLNEKVIMPLYSFGFGERRHQLTDLLSLQACIQIKVHRLRENFKKCNKDAGQGCRQEATELFQVPFFIEGIVRWPNIPIDKMFNRLITIKHKVVWAYSFRIMLDRYGRENEHRSFNVKNRVSG